jgi:ribosomal protein S18 acetylase RimI-like enzyme
MPASTILNIESVAFNAWPAAEVVELDGWRLRATAGVTRRANSVWPNKWRVASGDGKLEARLAAVEHFYASRGQPAVYQISPAAQPEALDGVLAAQGYTFHAPTFVQTTTVAAMLAALAPARDAPGFQVAIAERCGDAWFDLYCEAEAVTGQAAAVRRAILDRIAPASAFALLHVDGTPVAVGHGVVEAGWLGIYSMATAPSFRRRGAARTLLCTLATWAEGEGAEQAYLQVMEHNHAAQALYATAGFVTTYGYHYRVMA